MEAHPSLCKSSTTAVNRYAARIATVTNGDGDEVAYTYDLADRVTKEAFTGPQAAVTVSYSYDGAGNLHTQSDSSGTTTWTYDGRNQVLTKNAQSGGGTMSWTYDADGNMLTATDAGGTTRYAYNNLDQLSSLTDEAGDLWQFNYNQAGQRKTSWFDTNAGNMTWAAKEAWTYDTAGRITSIITTRDSAAPATVSSVSYSYTKYSGTSACTAPAVVSATTNTDLLQYSTNTVTGTISQYCYDIGNRLIEVTNDNGTTYNYTYDTDGDIKTGANKGAESYNSVSELIDTGYTYDGAGQQTATPGNGTETYNDAGQLTGLSNAGGLGQENIAYTGGAQDEVLADKSATAITYGLNGQDGQPSIQSYAPAGSATDYVIRDQQGDPLGYVQSGAGYAFLTDNLGSVANVTNAAGTTVATYTYDPYGHGGTPTGPDASQNLLQYTGALLDPASSNYLHLGDRWYNPVTANFSSQDPQTTLADPANANHYAYAGDNPANNTDPTGNESACKTLGWVALGVAVVGAVATGFGVAASVGVIAEGAAEATTAWTIGGGIFSTEFGLAGDVISQIC